MKQLSLSAAAGRLVVVAGTALGLAALLILGSLLSGSRSWLTGEGEAAATGKFHPPGAADSSFKDPFCAECHASPPHQRSLADRSLLNHHAVRLHCLVCHGAGLPGFPARQEWRERVLWPGGEALTRSREEEWRNAALTRGKCFAPGPGCRDCHREGGPVDFTQLGYDTARVKGLVRLEEFFGRTSSGKWFFPGIF